MLPTETNFVSVRNKAVIAVMLDDSSIFVHVLLLDPLLPMRDMQVRRNDALNAFEVLFLLEWYASNVSKRHHHPHQNLL